MSSCGMKSRPFSSPQHTRISMSETLQIPSRPRDGCILFIPFYAALPRLLIGDASALQRNDRAAPNVRY